MSVKSAFNDAKATLIYTMNLAGLNTRSASPKVREPPQTKKLTLKTNIRAVKYKKNNKPKLEIYSLRF